MQRLRHHQKLTVFVVAKRSLMATRKPHQPSVAYSWEHGCNNVSFGCHDRSARLGWGFRLVFTYKTKTDIVLTKRYSFTEKKLILILLKRPYIASTSLIVVSGDHVGKGFPPLFCSFALSKCYLLMNPYLFLVWGSTYNQTWDSSARLNRIHLFLSAYTYLYYCE